jgi:hypothetical protein
MTKNYNKIEGLTFNSYGHYKVYITYRNIMYKCITTNMPDVDLYKSNERGWKSAGNRLYNEVKRKNNLK